MRDGVIWNCQRFNLQPHLIDLYRYLIANNKIEDILDYNRNNLNVQTDKVLQLIKQGAAGWEEYVPDEVVAIIKDRHLFGYTGENASTKESTTATGDGVENV